MDEELIEIVIRLLIRLGIVAAHIFEIVGIPIATLAVIVIVSEEIFDVVESVRETKRKKQMALEMVSDAKTKGENNDHESRK